MGPQAKIAVLTFALREIEAGHQWPRDIARRAVRFVDDEVRIEIKGQSPREVLEAAIRPSLTPGGVAARDEATMVAAAEARAAERRKKLA